MTNSSSVAGIIAGRNPFEYSSASPYTLFFFQAILIILFAELLYVPLKKLKQPKVIAEVIGGILLGPSAIGKIPNFTHTVFPTDSLPGLTLMANVGVCLLLFTVGCEVDLHFIRKHIKVALSVGIFNMAVPFGLGALISIGLWKEYRESVEPHIKFTTFMVFVSVAMCITAFPVLARILTQLKLVKDRVGVIVLAAGVTNDLLGWVLLALCVTLANSSKPETTGYIVLVALGWLLFVVFPVRWVLRWFLFNVSKDVDSPSGPSQLSTLAILCCALTSAFFTDIIGVHAIFGAFVVGTIVPRENDYVVKLTSRIEDLIYILLVPLYFALAGLSVNFGLLNDGKCWGYIIGIISLAMAGKISGGFVAAKFNGLYPRESLSVGVLMSCKGIVEIVVLKTGLSSGIITPKLYSMFIVMALVTTVLTTPLTLLSYPESYRLKVQQWLRQKELGDRTSVHSEKDGSVHEMTITNRVEPTPVTVENYSEFAFSKLLFSITDNESVSNAMIFIERVCEGSAVHALYIKQLTERISDLILASNYTAAASYEVGKHKLNATLSILKIFCGFKNVDFTSEIRFVSSDDDSLFPGLASREYDPNGLLLHFVHQKAYIQYIEDHPGKLTTDLASFKAGNSSHFALFINNKQDQRPEADEQFTIDDDDSLFSTQTILNPESFQLTTMTLLLNISGSDSLGVHDLVSLKLFVKLLESRGFKSSTVLVNMGELASNDLELVQSALKGLDSSVLFNADMAFGKFVKDNTLNHDISSLVLVPSSCYAESNPLVESLIGQNNKVMVVYQ